MRVRHLMYVAKCKSEGLIYKGYDLNQKLRLLGQDFALHVIRNESEVQRRIILYVLLLDFYIEVVVVIS